MRYGKKPTDGMWRMTVSLRQTPLCPGCCEQLQGIVVEIRNGWAWCPICVATRIHRSKPIRWALATDEFRALATRQNGLFFYTPDVADTSERTAMEWAIDHGCTAPLQTANELTGVVNLVLPGGIHNASTIKLTPLRELQSQMKAIRNRKPAHMPLLPADPKNSDEAMLSY